MSDKGFSEHAKGKATSPRPGGAALPAEPPARICREASFTKPTEGLADIFARQWTTAWAEMPGGARLPRCRPAGPLWSKRAGAVLLLGRVAPWGAAIRRLLGGGGRFGPQISSVISGVLRPACGSPSGAPSPHSCLSGLRGGPRDPGVGLVDRSGSVWSPRLALTGFPIGSLLQSLSSWTLCL